MANKKDGNQEFMAQLAQALSTAAGSNAPRKLQDILTDLMGETPDYETLGAELLENEQYKKALAITPDLFVIGEEGDVLVDRTVRRITNVVRPGASTQSRNALTFEQAFQKKKGQVLRHFTRGYAMHDGLDDFEFDWKQLQETNAVLFNALYWAAFEAPELLPNGLDDNDRLEEFTDTVFAETQTRKIKQLLAQYQARGREVDPYWHDVPAAHSTPQRYNTTYNAPVASVVAAPVYDPEAEKDRKREALLRAIAINEVSPNKELVYAKKVLGAVAVYGGKPAKCDYVIVLDSLKADEIGCYYGDKGDGGPFIYIPLDKDFDIIESRWRASRIVKKSWKQLYEIAFSWGLITDTSLL